VRLNEEMCRTTHPSRKCLRTGLPGRLAIPRPRLLRRHRRGFLKWDASAAGDRDPLHTAQFDAGAERARGLVVPGCAVGSLPRLLSGSQGFPTL